MLKNSFAFVSRYFFYFFSFFAPFQAGKLLFGLDFFSSGFLNPYLSFFFYYSEFFLYAGILFFALSLIFGYSLELNVRSYRFFVVLAIFLLCVFAVLISHFSFFSFLFLLRAFALFIFYILVSSGFLNLEILLFYFLASLFVSALAAIYQFSIQGSVGLHFFGEPYISVTNPGLSKINVDGFKLIRPYAFLEHPNLLAAYMGFGSLLSLNFLEKDKTIFSILFLLFSFVLFLTFSRSAMFAFFLAIALYVLYLRPKFFSLFSLFFLLLFLFLVFSFDLHHLLFHRFFGGDDSMNLRSLFFDSAVSMLGHFQFFGYGLQSFTANVQNFLSLKLMPWDLQPVHNLFVLVFVEMGFFSLAFLAIFVFIFQQLHRLLKILSRKRMAFILALSLFVFVLANFDHYFWTIFQGNYLLWLYFAIFADYH